MDAAEFAIADLEAIKFALHAVISVLPNRAEVAATIREFQLRHETRLLFETNLSDDQTARYQEVLDLFLRGAER